MSQLGNPGKSKHAKYSVDTHFVLAVFDLDCAWHGTPPTYRIYVNDELFTERQWIWPSDFYLEQMLQIQAPAGKYVVRVEPVYPSQAEFSIRNNRVEHGPARWQKQHKIIIQP
jgi:hypothetical protein